MSRTQLLVLGFGLILIAFGILQALPSGSKSDIAEAAGANHGRSQAGTRDGSNKREFELTGVGGSRSTSKRADDRGAEAATNRPAEPKASFPLRVNVTLAKSGAPAAGATVSLWRSASGEGAAYRSPKRLVLPDPAADDEGHVTLEAPFGAPLEVIAWTRDGGPKSRVELGSLDPATCDSLDIAIEVEPPPAPLDLQVVDENGQPLPGVSVWLIAPGTQRWAEFPGQGELAKRTDGNGSCTLPGRFRTSGWLALDGAGRAPHVVRTESLTGTTKLTIELVPDVRAEVVVLDADGDPIGGALAELRFEIDGHACMRSAKTSSRGRAQVRSLPDGCEVFPSVILNDGAQVERFGAVRFVPAQREGGDQERPTIELRIK